MEHILAQAARYGQQVRDLENRRNSLAAHRVRTSWIAFSDQFRGDAFYSVFNSYWDARRGR